VDDTVIIDTDQLGMFTLSITSPANSRLKTLVDFTNSEVLRLLNLRIAWLSPERDMLWISWKKLPFWVPNQLTFVWTIVSNC